MPLTRRALLRTGLGGSLLLWASSACAPRQPAAPVDLGDDAAFRVLDRSSREIVAAIIPVMLAGALPDAPQAVADARKAALVGVDIAVSGLPPAVQDEIHQLFGMLAFAPTRWVLAGLSTSWDSAPPEAISAFLTRWRYSSLALLRSGYDALHQLVMAAWYGNDASWSRIGYPGPPKIAS